MRGFGTEGLRKFFVVFGRSDESPAGPGGMDRLPVRFEPLWELIALLEALEREARHPSNERQAICDSLLLAILRKLRGRESLPDGAGPRSRQTYLAAVRFIEEHVRELRSSGQVAERVGVDASYLCRLFQRHSGMSPHRYLTRLRMQYAMTLLTREGLNVTSVAEALGFENPFHFSRVFKNVHGLPPSAYFRKSA
jgi:AraC-like DNA-binding protein